MCRNASPTGPEGLGLLSRLSSLFWNQSLALLFFLLLIVSDSFRVPLIFLFLLQFPWFLPLEAPCYGFSSRQRTLLLLFIQVLFQVVFCPFAFFMTFRWLIASLLVFSLTLQKVQQLFILLLQLACSRCTELYFLSFLRAQFVSQWVFIFLLVFLKTFGLPCLFSISQVVLFTLQIQQFFILLQVLFIVGSPWVSFVPHSLYLNPRSTFYGLRS